MATKGTFFIDIANQVISGETPSKEVFQGIAATKDEDVFSMIAGADRIREAFFNREIHLCTICNGKSGKCSEDCSFCSQSKFADSDIEIYPLLSKEKLQAGALHSYDTPVNRYSIVTSGKRMPKEEIKKIAHAMSELDSEKLAYCVSLGILDIEDFEILKQAGVTRYHHNLETARSHFDNICTTHTFQDRVDTIKAAQKVGLSVCAGGILGTGESDEQVLELALELKELDVDAIPVNFLTPIKGTPLQYCNELTPQRCLKIIALFRYVIPDKDILICGGREYNLKLLHPLIFHAGASGMITGNYLTTSGIQLDDDLNMIHQLGFKVRP